MEKVKSVTDKPADVSDLTLSTAETVTGAMEKDWSVADKVLSAMETVAYVTDMVTSVPE